MTQDIGQPQPNSSGHSHGAEKYYLRLNLHERMQHHLTWSTFVVLAVTGFMVELPEEWVAVFGQYRDMVFYWRGIIHRVAAVVMVFNMVYQAGYVLLTAAGRYYLAAMLPRLQDARDIKNNLAYYLGWTHDKP